MTCRSLIRVQGVWLGRFVPAPIGGKLKGFRCPLLHHQPQGQIDKLILNDVTGDLWYYGVLDDVKNVAANYSTLLSAIKAQPGDGTIDTDAVVSQVKSIMVPTTTEILWGVISGDILSTAWERLTSNTGALLGLGFQQIAKITGTPFSQIFDFIGSGATYIGYVSGQQVSLSTSIKYPVLAGGIAVCQETTGSVRNMVQLMPMKIDKVGAASVLSSKGERFEMAMIRRSTCGTRASITTPSSLPSTPMITTLPAGTTTLAARLAKRCVSSSRSRKTDDRLLQPPRAACPADAPAAFPEAVSLLPQGAGNAAVL